jgi:hypothetical protein
LALPTQEELLIHVTVTSEKAERDLDRIDKNVDSLTRRFKSLDIGMRMLRFEEVGSMVTQIIPAVNALGAGFVGLTSALAPMTGLLALVPAGILSVGVAATAGILATGGLKEAFKAVDTQQKAALPTLANTRAQMDAQAAAARSLRNATEHLADAQRALQEALKPADVLDMRSAELQLERARMANADAVADQAKSMESLQKATELVYKSVTGVKDEFTGKNFEFTATVKQESGSKAEDIARKQIDANIRIKETQLAIEQAEKRIQELRLKGTETDKTVIDARRNLRNATEGVEDAQKRLNEAQVDGGKKALNANDALRRAMEKLAPEGKRFVEIIQGMKPEFEELRNRLQNIVFKGINDGLLSAHANAEIFKDMLRESGTVLSVLASDFGSLLGNKEFGERLHRAFKPANEAMFGIGQGIIVATGGLPHLLEAAKPLLDWAKEMGVKLGLMFQKWATAGNESGTLTTTFEKVRDTTDQFFRVLGNVWGAIKNVMSAAEPLGGWLFTSLEKTTQKWQDWTESAENASKMSEWFDDFKPLLSEIAGFTGDIIEAWVTFGGNNNLTEMIQKFRKDMLPAMEGIFKHLSDMGPKFMDLFTAITKTYGVLAEANIALGAVVTVFTLVATAIGKIVEFAPGFGTFVTGMITLAALKKFDSMIGFSTAIGNMFNHLKTGGGMLIQHSKDLGVVEGAAKTGAVGVGNLWSAMASPMGVGIAIMGVVAIWQNMTKNVEETTKKFKEDLEVREKGIKTYADQKKYLSDLGQEYMSNKRQIQEMRDSNILSYFLSQDEIAILEKKNEVLKASETEEYKVKRATDSMAGAFKISEEEARKFVVAQKDLGVNLDDNTTLITNYAKQVNDLAEQDMRKLLDATWDQIDAFQNMESSGDDWRSSILNIEDAHENLTKAEKANADTDGDLKVSKEELEKKNRSVERAQIAERNAMRDATDQAELTAKGALNLEEAEAKLEGKTLTAKEASEIQRLKLVELQGTTKEGSPLHTAIGQTIGKLGEFERIYEAEMKVKTEEANRKLIETIALGFLFSGGQIDQGEMFTLADMVKKTNVDRNWFYNFIGNFPGFENAASWLDTRQVGGRVNAGSLNLVGERGPELFMPAVSGTVLSHGETAARLGGMQATGLTKEDLQELVREMTSKAKPIEVNVDAPQYASPELLGRAVAWEMV